VVATHWSCTMATEITIFSIEAAPGDVPCSVEQPNGDLLIPAQARPLIEAALLKAELALLMHQYVERAAVIEAKRLLNIDQPEPQPAWLPNLFKMSKM
jgi:hypothetical protein